MAAQGYDVFEPMGFDAFGIHSENFAIKQGMHPAVLTARNVERFREQQLKRIGNRFDWSHEVNTTDPRYYKWTQWIFTQLFNAGLAERKKAAVNWCPNDKTVLADEQVIDGRCERCDALVERRELEQWFLKTTAYADRLLANIPGLDWPERVKVAQRNWIGRSEGLEFTFRVENPESHRGGREGRGESRGNAEVTETGRKAQRVGRSKSIRRGRIRSTARRSSCWRRSTRWSPAITSAEQRAAVDAYRREAVSRRAQEPGERGVSGAFTGAYALHPLTGERLPIWIADHVLMDYGAGAIMAAPAHDERDLAFARMFGLSVRVVVVVNEGPANKFANGEPANPFARTANKSRLNGLRPRSPPSRTRDRRQRGCSCRGETCLARRHGWRSRFFRVHRRWRCWWRRGRTRGCARHKRARRSSRSSRRGASVGVEYTTRCATG